MISAPGSSSYHNNSDTEKFTERRSNIDYKRNHCSHILDGLESAEYSWDGLLIDLQRGKSALRSIHKLEHKFSDEYERYSGGVSA